MDIEPPTGLRCEHLVDPLGVDVSRPLLSWTLENPGRGQTVRAFRVIVASDEENALKETGDVWDSGLVTPAGSNSVEYGGKRLRSCTRYHWRVMWVSGGKEASRFSDVARFGTGLLDRRAWKARWIGRARCTEHVSGESVNVGITTGPLVLAHGVYLRKEFSTPCSERVRRATACICGLGFYELYMNGRRVGDRVLDPAQTDYGKTALYSTYDVTDLVGERNAVGILLGNGRYIKNYGFSHPRAILQIQIEYVSGGKETIVTDGSWKCSHGPLLENGLYSGERYDARLEMPGWDQPGFSDSDWDRAVTLRERMPVSQMVQPIRVTRTITPDRVSKPEPGIHVVDFGQNFAGWVRLRMKGPRGTRISLRYAELVDDEGMLNMGPNQKADASDIYIMKGGGPESFEPKFTYHGFRYVEVKGYPGTLTKDDIQGRALNSDMEGTGRFRCSNGLFNKIHDNILRGFCSNAMGLPTDCPQRDERYGWLADAHLAAEMAMFNYHTAAFYRKFLRDIRLAQKRNGSLPNVAPPYLPLYPADPAWGSAYITIAWLLHNHYGDTRLLREHYPYMKRYVDFLSKVSEDHVIRGIGKFGDWCSPGETYPKKTPVELTSTWYYFHDVLLLSRIAGLLGERKDAETLSNLSERIRDSFNREFFDGVRYRGGGPGAGNGVLNQTSNILPLSLGMVPEGKEKTLVEEMVSSLKDDHDHHLDTGIVGTRYILDVLTDAGHGEAACRVASQRTYPGWGYMIERGATTLWERWEEYTGDGMNSHNHIMFGSIDAWFYRVLAGISCLSPGWGKIQVRPHVLGELTFAEAAVKTVRGTVSVSWRRDDDSFTMDLQVPVGCESVIWIPLLWKGASIREGDSVIWERGKKTETVKDISFTGVDGMHAGFRSGSGTFRFVEKRQA